MKRLRLPARFLIAVSILTGCQSCATNKANSEFPDFLVGTWQASGRRWQITFQPDGSISSLHHQYITVPVKPEEGGVYEPLRKDAYGIYFFGPYDVKYNPGTRELSVEIIVDDFHIEMPAMIFDGNMYDHFIGTVSDDGMTWRGKWYNRIEMPDFGPTDPSEIMTKPITFQKID